MILPNRANEENVSLTLNGNDISRVTIHKFLGAMIDKTLRIKYVLRFRNQQVLSDESLIWCLIMYFTASTMVLYIHA